MDARDDSPIFLSHLPVVTFAICVSVGNVLAADRPLDATEGSTQLVGLPTTVESQLASGKLTTRLTDCLLLEVKFNDRWRVRIVSGKPATTGNRTFSAQTASTLAALPVAATLVLSGPPTLANGTLVKLAPTGNRSLSNTAILFTTNGDDPDDDGLGYAEGGVGYAVAADGATLALTSSVVIKARSYMRGLCYPDAADSEQAVCGPGERPRSKVGSGAYSVIDGTVAVPTFSLVNYQPYATGTLLTIAARYEKDPCTHVDTHYEMFKAIFENPEYVLGRLAPSAVAGAFVNPKLRAATGGEDIRSALLRGQVVPKPRDAPVADAGEEAPVGSGGHRLSWPLSRIPALRSTCTSLSNGCVCLGECSISTSSAVRAAAGN